MHFTFCDLGLLSLGSGHTFGLAVYLGFILKALSSHLVVIDSYAFESAFEVV